MSTKLSTIWKDLWSTSSLEQERVKQVAREYDRDLLHAMAGQGILSGVNAAQQSIGAYASRSWNDPLSGMKFEVITAENGYVLKVAANEGDRWRLYVANNVDDIRDLITSQMVTQRMEK